MDDPFDVFGLPRRFDLDPQELHRRYIRESSRAHPDRTSDPVEQAEAAERAAVINGAYLVLQDPQKRAGVLLSLLGGPGGSDDKSLPPELLMEVMEAREKMEEAEQAGDQESIAASVAWAKQQFAVGLERVSGFFRRLEDDQEGDHAGLLKAIRLELNALRYFRRMIDQAPGGGKGKGS